MYTMLNNNTIQIANYKLYYVYHIIRYYIFTLHFSKLKILNNLSLVN